MVRRAGREGAHQLRSERGAHRRANGCDARPRWVATEWGRGSPSRNNRRKGRDQRTVGKGAEARRAFRGTWARLYRGGDKSGNPGGVPCGGEVSRIVPRAHSRVRAPDRGEFQWV